MVVMVWAGSWVIADAAPSGTLPVFSYQHTPPEGFTAHERTPISVFIDADEGVQNVRLYFRPYLLGDYLYIELQPDAGGGFFGELPAFDASLTGLEYLFVWKNSATRVVRTAAYSLAQTGAGEGLTPSYGSLLTLLTETEVSLAHDVQDLLVETVSVEQVMNDDLHLGMRTGLYDMSSDSRYRYGFFGGFIYEPAADRTFPTKGYVNFGSPTGSTSPRTLEGSQTTEPEVTAPALSKTEEGYPNVAGDDWRGVFYRTGSSGRTSITAVITHDGAGNITVETSLSGLGHYFTGDIGRGYSGHVELREKCCGSNEGEIWTTHDLDESTSTYFGFEDYVDTTYQALYRIELERSEPEPPSPDVSWLPSVLQLLLLD